MRKLNNPYTIAPVVGVGIMVPWPRQIVKEVDDYMNLRGALECLTLWKYVVSQVQEQPLNPEAWMGGTSNHEASGSLITLPILGGIVLTCTIWGAATAAARLCICLAIKTHRLLAGSGSAQGLLGHKVAIPDTCLHCSLEHDSFQKSWSLVWTLHSRALIKL